MATSYYLTTTASDLGTGSNFSNTLPATAPGTTTLALSVATATTETDFGHTQPGIPGTGGVTGDYDIRVAINTGNADLQLSVQIHRVNSAGTVQTSSSASSEQTASAGEKTFTFLSQSLGTWAAGDRLRLDLILRDTSAHGDESLTYDIGSAGVRISTPWTAPSPIAGTSAGVATVSGTLVGIGVLAGTSAGVATVTGTLGEAASGAISGSSAGVATVTGTLKGRGALRATSDGVATVAGTLKATGALRGTSAGVATAAGILLATGVLSGASAGVATTSGVLKGRGVLAGTSAGVATVTGTLGEHQPGAIAGSSAGVATVTGTLRGTGVLTGTSAGVATVTGTIGNAAAVSAQTYQIDIERGQFMIDVMRELPAIDVTANQPFLLEVLAPVEA